MAEKIVVTRHPALIEYLRETGLVDDETKIVSHASKDDVEGKDVIGILPLNLACHAASITEVPLNLTEDLRGKELTIEDMRKIAERPVKYKVLVID